MHNFVLFLQTEKGSALHEAALFGKADVVQKLLSAGSKCLIHAYLTFTFLLLPVPTFSCLLGIDVNITDLKGLTALDTVKDMPSQKSKEIAALILGKKKKKKNAMFKQISAAKISFYLIYVIKIFYFLKVT